MKVTLLVSALIGRYWGTAAGVHVLVGREGSGKSSLLTSILLSLLLRGQRCALYSSDLSGRLQTRWLLQSFLKMTDSEIDDESNAKKVEEGKLLFHNRLMLSSLAPSLAPNKTNIRKLMLEAVQAGCTCFALDHVSSLACSGLNQNFYFNLHIKQFFSVVFLFIF